MRQQALEKQRAEGGDLEGFDADEVDEAGRMDGVDRESAEARPATGESNEAESEGGIDGGDVEDDGEGHSEPEVDRADGSTKRPYEGEGEGEDELAKRRKQSA